MDSNKQPARHKQAASKKQAAKKRPPAKKPPLQPALAPQPDELVFALDIGTRTIIGIVGVWEDENFRVIDFEQMEHPGRAMVDGQVEDIAQVGALMTQVKQRLEGRLGVKLSRVAIAAAGRMLRTVRVKAQRVVEPRSAVDREFVVGLEGEAIELAQTQIRKNTPDVKAAGGFYCVGYSIVEYGMDDQSVSQLVGHICSSASVELIAAFLPNSVVEGLYGAVDISGLEVVSLTLEPIAAINVLIPQELRLLNLALVDIGAGTSDIAICREGAIYNYEMATIAGDELTEAIIRELLVDFETAETIKRALGSGDKNPIPYTNILGMDNEVTLEALAQAVQPALQQLARTIAAKILDCNGQAPAAVFLIGGGSQIPGLNEALAECLGIPASKIAVGARRSLKSVDIAGNTALLGPEFVTPIGIAVTCITQACFHFFGVTVNKKKLKLLNTAYMRCIDVLMMAGYRAHQIMGQSGRTLLFTCNGQRRVIKGELPVHAVITRNGESANIETEIRPGDVLELVPARNGASGSAQVADLIAEIAAQGKLPDGSVQIEGKTVALGLHATVNGLEVTPQYAIRPHDDVRLQLVRTLQDVLRVENLPMHEAYGWDGYPLELQDVLEDAMHIQRLVQNDAPVQETAPSKADTPAAQASPAAQAPPAAQASPAAQAPLVNSEPAAKEPASIVEAAQAAPGGAQVLQITLNGQQEVLPLTQQTPRYYMMNLLEKTGVDLTDPQGIIQMMVNGESVGFMKPIRNGDNVEIGWGNS